MNIALVFSTLLLITLSVSVSFMVEGMAQWLGSLALGAACILGPIFWYYRKLKRKLQEQGGLSDNDIDGVYYYGFLITLGTLAVTIVAVGVIIGIDPESLSRHLTKIVPQFGFGLLATGLALLARLRLLGKDEEARAKPDVYQSAERLAGKIDKLVYRFDAVSQKIGNLADQAQARSDSLLAAYDVAETQFHERLDKAAALFGQRLRAGEAQFKQVEDELDAAAKRAQAQGQQMELEFQQAAAQFSQYLAQAAQESLAQTGAAIGLSVEPFGRAVAQLAAEAGRLRPEMETVSFDAAAKRLEAFVWAMEGALGSAQAAADASGQNAAAAIRTLAAAAQETHDLAARVADNLGRLEGLDGLVAQIGQVGQGLEKIALDAGRSGDSLRDFGLGAREAASASAELGRRLDNVADSFTQTANANRDTSEILARLADTSRATHALALGIAARLDKKPWYLKTVGEAWRDLFGRKG
jgi:hypothetical protein